MARLARPTWLTDRLSVQEQSDKLLMPSGFVAESYPRKQHAGSTLAVTAGVLTGVATVLPKGEPITKIRSYATVVPTAPTNQWAAILHGTTRAVLAVSADRTNTALGTGANEFTLGATYTPTDDELVYLCIMNAGGDGGTFRAFNSSASFGVDTGVPLLGVTSSAAQTTPPAVAAVQTAFTSIAGQLYLAAIA